VNEISADTAGVTNQVLILYCGIVKLPAATVAYDARSGVEISKIHSLLHCRKDMREVDAERTEQAGFCQRPHVAPTIINLGLNQPRDKA
jgi:hypothetical protein